MARSSNNSRREAAATESSWLSVRRGGGDDLIWYRWVNLLSYIANVGVTYGVGVAGLFGLQTNTVVSAKYPTLVTPAGYAFAIWGIIFLMQGIWVVQQFITCIPGVGRRLSYTDKIVAVRLNYLFVVLAQVMWTITFANEWIMPSAIVMLVLLWNLGVIVFSQLKPLNDIPWYSNFLTKFPFHIHFGWIFVAAIVNINVALTSADDVVSTTIRFYGGAIGGLTVLVLASMLMILGAGFYFVIPAVAVWGLLAVYAADQSSLANDYTADQLMIVRNGALGSAILIAVVALGQGIRKLVVAIRARKRGTINNNGDSSGPVYYRSEDEDDDAGAGAGRRS
jgi:hypothetical protein